MKDETRREKQRCVKKKISKTSRIKQETRERERERDDADEITLIEETRRRKNWHRFWYMVYATNEEDEFIQQTKKRGGWEKKKAKRIICSMVGNVMTTSILYMKTVY
jgi:hypothetical protein